MMDKTMKGFSLISAIFLLVVVAALGTFAVTISTTQQQSAAMDVLGSRAYQAARAGIEWEAYQVLQNGGCAAGPPVMPPTSTLAGFAVTIPTCTTAITTEAGTTVTTYQITSIATQGVSPNYIERQLTVTIAACTVAGVPTSC